jgi:hypothetical protein
MFVPPIRVQLCKRIVHKNVTTTNTTLKANRKPQNKKYQYKTLKKAKK